MCGPSVSSRGRGMSGPAVKADRVGGSGGEVRHGTFERGLAVKGISSIQRVRGCRGSKGRRDQWGGVAGTPYKRVGKEGLGVG